MATQVDVDRWVALLARAYAEACTPGLSAAEVAQLARTLDGPVADCIMLGEAPNPRRIDPALERWEAAMCRQPGPRLGRVDYGRGTVEMRS